MTRTQSRSAVRSAVRNVGEWSPAAATTERPLLIGGLPVLIGTYKILF